MCVGSDLFDAIVLGPPTMPRDHAHPSAGLAQMAHDATANKAAPSASQGDFLRILLPLKRLRIETKIEQRNGSEKTYLNCVSGMDRKEQTAPKLVRACG